MKKHLRLFGVIAIVAVLALALGAACAGTSGTDVGAPSASSGHPEGWTDETHSSAADPNYEVVFPQDKVNQIKITIAPEDWEAMQANMTELFGEGSGFPDFGEGGEFPDFGEGGEFPDFGEGGELPDFGFGGVGPGGGGADMTTENPMWVPATIEFNGLTWTNVGVRYKGNSSLRSGWSSGSLKLPLKLDFDEFEDEYPEIDNQRFYGFKQLSLSNAFGDSTYMRDVISADLLEESGLVAAETAYYEVILDYGEGPVNLGLYVVIEVIDDTVIERYFGDDSGNIYEGEGSGVSLAAGTFNQIQDSFDKENNVAAADWSDIEALYNVLHSEERTSDPEAWRESLESIFDVDAFLEWLAISALIEHWDAYGSMSHNFYLYHDPDTDLLTWISWDHNLVLGGFGGMGGPGGEMGEFMEGFGGMGEPGGEMEEFMEEFMEWFGGMGEPRGGMGGFGFGSTSLDRENVGENWPLIRYLLDDPIYYDRYVGYIAEVIDGSFNPDKMEEECQELAELIAPYLAKEGDEAAFMSAVQALIDRIYERVQVARDFLSTGE